MEVVIGIDIGQKHDPTAICVSERESRSVDGRSRTHHLVRHLERLPIGLPYPQVGERLTEIARGIRDKTGYGPELCIDATGVGLPVVDALADDHEYLSHVTVVYFTHGDRVTYQDSHRYKEILLGKAYLVSQLQVLLQHHEIHLPETPEARALARELLDYEIRVDEDANNRYGAFRVGTHDDLVTALGLTLEIPPRLRWIGPSLDD